MNQSELTASLSGLPVIPSYLPEQTNLKGFGTLPQGTEQMMTEINHENSDNVTHSETEIATALKGKYLVELKNYEHVP